MSERKHTYERRPGSRSEMQMVNDLTTHACTAVRETVERIVQSAPNDLRLSLFAHIVSALHADLAAVRDHIAEMAGGHLDPTHQKPEDEE